MWKQASLLTLTVALAACSGGDRANPVNGIPEDPDEETPTEEETFPLPGTEDPSPDGAIERREARSEAEGGADVGNGFAESVMFDPATDTFTVDNIAFDGANDYSRDRTFTPNGALAVYESPDFIEDPVTGVAVGQLQHRAVFGRAPGGSEVAIVRTGSFVDYGFGGFVYSRPGGVDLPTTGQAGYRGPYSGLRDFQNRAGLEYVAGRMEMAIDFEDYNGDDGRGVRGTVFDRRVFDIEGNDITDEIVTALGAEGDVIASALPVLVFDVGPGVSNADGEITGQIRSQLATEDGALQQFEGGNYYAVLGGQNASEVVGVIVVEAEDPRFEGVTVRETGGFVLTRD